MAYVETWDETKPAGTRDANLGDDDIREFKRAVRERLAGGGMNFPSTDDADAGLYNSVKFIEQSSAPTSEANRGYLYTKDVSGVTELYWMDSGGSTAQLTSGGKILISSLVIGSEAQGDVIYRGASAWARLGAGTSGQFLKTQGAAANPAWADVAFQTAASQAEMEASSSTTVPVTPGRQHYHPSAPKAWCMFNGQAAGTNAPTAGYNVASVTRNGEGDYTITFTNAMSSANYCVIGSSEVASAGSPRTLSPRTLATGSVQVRTGADNVGLEDGDIVCVAVFGDL